MTNNKLQAVEFLKSILTDATRNENGKTVVYGQVMHVAPSGMSRSIKYYVVVGGFLHDITFYVAEIHGKQRDKYWGLTVKGCGMDMVNHAFQFVISELYGLHDIYQSYAEIEGGMKGFKVEQI